MGTEKAYVGIDVSKETLDVAVHATDRRWRFANSDKGITETVSCLEELCPTLVVLEATGRYGVSPGSCFGSVWRTTGGD